MNLPNGGSAIIDERKVREYLVSPSHPIGRFKAKFFASLGFRPDNWQELAAALAKVAAKGDAQLVEDNEHGRKYLVSWTLTGPQGRSADIVSVWILRVGDDSPRLVTVYPR